MSRVPLTNGFSLMAEGEHVLKIHEVDYKEEYGKVKLTMVNAEGKKHFENFTLFDNDGNPKDAACGAFSALARAAMCDSSLEDVDPVELKGCYIKGIISYRTYEDKNGNTRKTTQKEPGTWWEEVSDAEITEFKAHENPPAAKKASTATDSKATTNTTPAPAKKPTGNFDLSSLLGR